jgi:glycosyltransferase involved in cell wall biosynthesis
MFEKLRGILPCGEAFMDICRQYTENVPLFIYDSGVDTTLFKRKEKPKQFSIGTGEKFPQSQMEYFHRFLKYPYPKYTSSEGLGTSRKYTDMPELYEAISVLIDPTNDSRPGGMMFLEAGAVGRPSIAMKEGILAKWFPDKYLVEDDQGFIDLINKLHDDEGFYQDASDEWYKIALSRDYSIVAKEFDEAFDSIVKR